MVANGLPEQCFVLLPGNNEVVLVKRGESGYYPTREGNAPWYGDSESLRKLNQTRFGVTPAQAEAMLVGSMFGWDVPGADPAMYDEEGNPKRKQ